MNGVAVAPPQILMFGNETGSCHNATLHGPEHIYRTIFSECHSATYWQREADMFLYVDVLLPGGWPDKPEDLADACFLFFIFLLLTPSLKEEFWFLMRVFLFSLSVHLLVCFFRLLLLFHTVWCRVDVSIQATTVLIRGVKICCALEKLLSSPVNGKSAQSIVLASCLLPRAHKQTHQCEQRLHGWHAGCS